MGYNPQYFSYPFGEYGLNLKNIVKNYDFKFAFGQHSGAIDLTKNHFELPRFPINESYGEIERFKFIINTLPFQFKKIYPENKYLETNENPPNVKIVFFEKQKNLNNITCYSNEGNRWRKSKVFLEKENILLLKLMKAIGHF